MSGRQGSLLTLSYLGAMRSLPNYNVMGLAKASLEANVDTWQQALALRAPVSMPFQLAHKDSQPRALKVSGKMLDYNARQTPLRRNVTIDEVGNAAAFLSSDLASGISGEILYVDGGFNTTAMGDWGQASAL